MHRHNYRKKTINCTKHRPRLPWQRVEKIGAYTHKIDFTSTSQRNQKTHLLSRFSGKQVDWWQWLQLYSSCMHFQVRQFSQDGLIFLLFWVKASLMWNDILYWPFVSIFFIDEPSVFCDLEAKSKPYITRLIIHNKKIRWNCRSTYG